MTACDRLPVASQACLLIQQITYIIRGVVDLVIYGGLDKPEVLHAGTLPQLRYS